MMFLESNSFENSNFDPNIFQHHVTFRNLSEGKGTVRLNSGHPLRYQKLPKIKEEDIAKNIPGEYAACGFEVLLTRKHEPLVYQVNRRDNNFFSLIKYQHVFNHYWLAGVHS